MTEFPIYLKEREFLRRGFAKTCCVAAEDRRLLEEFQPYSPTHGRPDDPTADPLWLLHKLDVADKHTLLNTTAVIATFQKLTVKVHDVEIVSVREYPRLRDLKYGSVLARYEIRHTGPNPEIEVEAEGTFDVVFGQRTPAPNKRLLSTLYEIRARVWKIAEAFRPRFF